MNLFHARVNQYCHRKYIYICRKHSIVLRFPLKPLFGIALVFVTWIVLLILLSGDVHLNPGPSSSEGSTSSYTNDLYNFLNYPNHLSTVHYNVQSLRHNVDVLFVEFSKFDVISFSETWLDKNNSSTELLFPSFHCAERKDRENEPYGGVIIYIKNSLSYVRRHDLEPDALECVWVHVKLCNSRNVLYGVIYRPPNSTSVYNSLIEESIGRAIDTNITDIIITRDFNWNQLNVNHSNKVNSLCSQFSLFQCINEPTHYTEHSASIIDLLLVSNKHSVLVTGVGEPCLDNRVRYHCPVLEYSIILNQNTSHSEGPFGCTM